MKSTDLHILFIGDSITNGEFVQRIDTFPVKVFEGMQKISKRKMGGQVVANDNWTTRLALISPDFQTMMRWKPEIAFIQFGLNDCNRWVTEGGVNRVNIRSFNFNLREIVQRLHVSGCDCVYLINMHKTAKGEDYETDAQAYNRGIERIPESTIGTYIINVRQEIEPEKHLLPDGVHLNTKGHKFYAKIILEQLVSAMDGEPSDWKEEFKKLQDPNWVNEFLDWQDKE